MITVATNLVTLREDYLGETSVELSVAQGSCLANENSGCTSFARTLIKKFKKAYDGEKDVLQQRNDEVMR